MSSWDDGSEERLGRREEEQLELRFGRISGKKALVERLERRTRRMTVETSRMNGFEDSWKE